MGRVANSKLYNNKEFIKAVIKEVMASIDMDVVAKDSSSFRSLLEKVLVADGDGAGPIE